MNFKKLAEQKIDELSGKIPMKVVDNDSVDLVLEGLDDENSLVESSEETFELELGEETYVEVNSEEIEQPSIQNLFDGYLGEQKEAPNPLEYGPNATYRNLREGIVYKKNSENLWEAFLKDGKPGKQGQSLGSGVGVEEVKRIISENVVPTPIIPSQYSYSRTLSNFLEPVYSSATSGVTTGKYVSDTGVETSSVTYSISPFYEAPGKKFVLLNELNSYPAQRGVIYDQNKNFMNSIVSQRPNSQAGSTFILSAVSGDSSATYFRFNYLHNTTLSHMLYVGIERTVPTNGFSKVSFMGDSITHGTYTYALSGGFASAVSQFLGCEMQNLGSPGNKMTGVGGMATRISACDQNADCVVLMGGYNDYLNSVVLGPTSSTNISEFYGALNSIGNYFTSARIWQKLYVCTPTRSNSSSANAQGLLLSSYADAIKLKASEFGISLIDCYYEGALEPKISAAWRSLYFPDGLHPSWWGDYMLGSYIAQQMTIK